jgi:TRAP-type C4-dicarboxylate transport system substrate-binding protein
MYWKTEPHVVYIDSDTWKDLSPEQKNVITDRANLACKSCGCV